MKIYGSKNMRLYMPSLVPRNERWWGVNEVGDHDEDYVFDALFDVPNK